MRWFIGILQFLFIAAELTSVLAQTSSSACVSDAERTDCGYHGITEKECIQKDCCWTPSNKDNEPWCYNKTVFLPGSVCIKEAIRHDCGYYGINDTECVKDRGCCWDESKEHGVPWCFYKSKPLPAECKVDKPRTDCGYFGVKEEECTNLGCCWTPSPDKDVPWCYNKTEEEEDNDDDDDIITWSSELELTGITSACVKDAPRTDCGHYGIGEKECTEKDCCWTPTDKGPWCYNKTTFLPDSICIEEAIRYDCGYHGIDKAKCLDKGCCWAESDKHGVPWCFYKSKPLPAECKVDKPRTDCGYFGIKEEECTNLGCCWTPSPDKDVPWCYNKTEKEEDNDDDDDIITWSSELELTGITSACVKDAPRTDCGHYGIGEKECTEKDCCWTPTDKGPWCYNKTTFLPDSICIEEAIRYDCGYYGINKAKCLDKGCCWAESDKYGVPWCFYKSKPLPAECKVDKPRTDCGYFGIKEEECTDLGCCWTPSPDKDVPWCYNKTEGKEEEEEEEDIITLSNELELTGITSACVKDAPRTDCGHYGIDEKECTEKDCCWTPTADKGPWCYNKTTFLPDSICIEEAIRYDCGYYGIDKAKCLDKGCCWAESDKHGVPWCFYKSKPLPAECKVDKPRTDCGYFGIKEEECTNLGCCWTPSPDKDVPWCYNKTEEEEEEEEDDIMTWSSELESTSITSACVSDAPRTDCGHYGIDEKECAEKGCCWNPTDHDVPQCFYKTNTAPSASHEDEGSRYDSETVAMAQQASKMMSGATSRSGSSSACIGDAPRTDCGYVGITEQQCHDKGCCWNPTNNKPWCYSKTVFTPDFVCKADAARYDCGYFGITEAQCSNSGCCWAESDQNGVPWCFYKTGPQQLSQCKLNGPRFDCGYTGITDQQCIQQGCCWDPKDNEPYCFHKSPFYTVKSVKTEGATIQMTLSIENTVNNLPYGDNISPLLFQLTQETDDRLHIKITDPNNKRWEVPESILKTTAAPSNPPANSKYTFSLPKEGEEFYFAVQRKSNKQTIFNTSSYGVLQFSDQYIATGTSLPTGYNIYGLGERKDHLRLKPTGNKNCGNTFPILSNDMPTIPENFNLYGVHPFYMELSTDGTGDAHGVFLKSSNGMDVVLNDNSLQYKIIGGILDFYFFLGPEPEAVISQYVELVGRPDLPPYWTLGFHQCRYGYTQLKDLTDVIDNFEKNKIPLDTIWSDIDYMDRYKDFTLDPVRFSAPNVQAFIKDIHSKGLHYVVILDPGIAIDKGYPAYDHGLADDVFVKDQNGNNLVGNVWPGRVHFPDFHNPKTLAYWQKEIADFLTNLADVDGLWIDMNECANFCDGYCPTVQVEEKLEREEETRAAKPEGQRNKRSPRKFDPRRPPYNINHRCNKSPLSTRTLPVEATYYGGITEYDAHNLYGVSEAITTYNALKGIRPTKRPFVLTRSNYPGAGAYAAHWNGDNSATETDLYYSLPMMLSYQLFGIPFVGSDICGFFQDTTEELCRRWMQLGAFYPFARNHNFLGLIPQEPYRWASVADVSRKALAIRYSLLPYYYTLFYKSNLKLDASRPPAATVVRPLFFEFPKDTATYNLDWQFMIGSALLVSPVLRVGDAGKSVNAYFPAGVWYDWYTNMTTSAKGSETINIPTPYDMIPIHIRGGSIIPMQDPGLNTAESRANLFSLLVALDSNGDASGDLYVDDGESLDVTNKNTYLTFAASKNTIVSTTTGDYASNMPPLDRLTVLGVANKPSSVTLNQKPVTFHFNATSNSLLVGPGLKNPLTQKFTLQWK